MDGAVIERPAHLPDFRNPPVREVAVGVHFEPLRSLRQAHFGLFWERIRTDYPITEDRESLSPQILSEIALEPAFQLVVSDSPPLNRAWFMSNDRSLLVQLQNDRLIHNWRYQGEEYPHFEPLLTYFQQAYGQLKSMLADLELSKPQRTQVEVTYVNQIEAESLERMFREYVSLPIQAEGVAVLPDRETLALRYPILMNESQIGRLHIEAVPRVQDTPSRATESYRLVLAFRAASSKADEIEADAELLRRGRETIVQVFTALTREEDHKKWGRFK